MIQTCQCPCCRKPKLLSDPRTWSPMVLKSDDESLHSQLEAFRDERDSVAKYANELETQVINISVANESLSDQLEACRKERDEWKEKARKSYDFCKVSAAERKEFEAKKKIAEEKSSYWADTQRETMIELHEAKKDLAGYNAILTGGPDSLNRMIEAYEQTRSGMNAAYEKSQQDLKDALEALEEIREEADALYVQDNTLFMNCSKEGYKNLGEYSRHLQTFGWLQDKCTEVIAKIRGRG